LSSLYSDNINILNLDGCLIYNVIASIIQITNPSFNVKNVIISNCILNQLNNQVGSYMLVLNNIFFARTYTGNYSNSLNCKYTIFQNNIFCQGNPSGAEYSSFNYNLTFNKYNNTIPYGNNNGSNNIINQNPKYNDNNAAIGANEYINVSPVISGSVDLRLADDSPARNVGADSTDIGISGGLYPWPRNADGTYDYSGRPRLPEIESFNLINPIVGTNGRLKFNVKGNKVR
jgi:hypothetical protein